MSINAFSAGKKTFGNTKTNIGYNSGKMANMSGAKPTASSGMKTGTRVQGDPKGAPVQGMGKK